MTSMIGHRSHASRTLSSQPSTSSEASTDASGTEASSIVASKGRPAVSQATKEMRRRARIGIIMIQRIAGCLDASRLTSESFAEVTAGHRFRQERGIL